MTSKAGRQASLSTSSPQCARRGPRYPIWRRPRVAPSSTSRPISGLQPTGRSPAYGAVKAAVIQLTMSQAVSLARKKIRVNCIAPGSIEFPGRIMGAGEDFQPGTLQAHARDHTVRPARQNPKRSPTSCSSSRRRWRIGSPGRRSSSMAGRPCSREVPLRTWAEAPGGAS